MADHSSRPISDPASAFSGGANVLTLLIRLIRTAAPSPSVSGSMARLHTDPTDHHIGYDLIGHVHDEYQADFRV